MTERSLAQHSTLPTLAVTALPVPVALPLPLPKDALRSEPTGAPQKTATLPRLMPTPVSTESAVATASPAPNVRDWPESELVQGALSGHDECWSVLIARHNHRVLVSLLGRGVPLERAKELAQETWLRLLKSQREGKLTELALPGLAIVQAGYLAGNDQRQLQRRKHHGEGHFPVGGDEPRMSTAEAAQPGVAVGASSCDEARPAESQLILQEDLGRITAALRKCTPAAQRIFLAVYENPELSYADVATRLGLSTQRVKQTVCEVRKCLRAALTDVET